MGRRVLLAFLLALGIAGFSTAGIAGVPNAPVFIEPHELAHPADVHMEIEGFGSSGGHSHASTDWEIRLASTNELVWKFTRATGFQRLHVHLPEGDYVGVSQLEHSTDYRVSARFRDSAVHVSDWSTRPFRTYDAEPPGDPDNAWTVEDGYKLEVFAGGFQLPVNIAFVPNPGPRRSDPYFYVAELYGNVKVVTRDGKVSTYAHGLLNFDPTADEFGSGEAGLAGLAIDPRSGDLFVTLVYEAARPPGAEETPVYGRVLRLKSKNRGRVMARKETVLNVNSHSMASTSHQISRATFGPDGKLYVHVGEGHAGGLPQSLESYLGKILRLNRDGSAPSDNPFYDGQPITPKDYVYTRGFRNPYGGDWRAKDGHLYVAENGPSVDRLSRQDRGENYGWGMTGVDRNEIMELRAIYNWSPAQAPVNAAWVQPETFGGSGFPVGKQDHLFVTLSGNTWTKGPSGQGKRIHEFVIDDQGELVGSGPTTFVEYDGTGYSNTVGLAAGPDGLYFSEFFKPNPSGNPPMTPHECCSRIFRVRHESTPPIDVPGNGTSGPDVLEGGPRANELHGLGGNDVLRGFGGNDVLLGGAGADRVWGGSGNDRLFGESGNDQLTGDAGADHVQAGRGADTVRVRGRGHDHVTCGPGDDRVIADRHDTVARSCERVNRG